MMIKEKLYKNTRYALDEIMRSKIVLQAVLVGFAAGLLVVAFRLGINYTYNALQNFESHYPFYIKLVLIPLIAALGGLISGFLVLKFAPETKGSGIPYIKAVLLKTGRIVRLRSIIVKYFAGISSIASGLSLGREGPCMQLGAGGGELVSRLFKTKGINKDNLIAAGAASAIAATFNAPVAGVMFAIEELTNKISPSFLFPVLIATICADSLSRYAFGARSCFVISKNISLPSLSDFPLYIFLGIGAAFFGVLFCKLIFFFKKVFQKITVPNYLKPALAGLLTGLVGVYLPLVQGSGNLAVDVLLEYKLQIGIVLALFVFKLVLTPLCFSSGAAGGIFLPTLMLGAFWGYIAAFILNAIGFHTDYILFSILGMSAFLSGVARTPITAFVMVVEMTGSYDFVLPLMLTCAVSDLTAQKFGHKPIYATLMEEFKN